MNKKISKPRNHVVMAMIRSNKHSGAHNGNKRVILEKQINRESERAIMEFQYEEYEIF